MSEDKLLQELFEACMVGGAIGDAWGSSQENVSVKNTTTTYFLGRQTQPVHEWAFTDDTQLNMATCETLCLPGEFKPALLAENFVRYYKERRLTGLGSSTLKAITELQEGGHWSLVGRSGEFAAGNGAAMRIAPFAFYNNISRDTIRDSCRITHKNDEAYVGALAIIHCLKSIVSKAWNGENNLFDLIIPELPDTSVRDRLIEISSFRDHPDINSIAQLGNNGYVVNSIPLAIFAASLVLKIGLPEMYKSVIEAGGDTDTNASLAGQIAGTLIGINNFPKELTLRLEVVDRYDWVRGIIEKTKTNIVQRASLPLL
jgi:ADP-ribosyl-[dinitrogen reductase] hydrolase